MKNLLPILLLLLASNLWSQPILDTGTRLSEDHQYLASVTLMEKYIKEHPDRFFDLSQAYFLISYNYMQLGDYTAALAANQQSLEIRDQILADNISENYMRAGAIHLLMGDYERAIDLLYTAYNLPIEDPQSFALTSGYMAAAQQALGNYDKALEGYQQAREILEIELGDDHPDLATNYYNLGTLYLEWGKEEQAQSALEQGLAIAMRWPERRDQLGRIYNALGLLCTQEDPEKAMDYFHQAEGVLQLAYGDFHPELIRTKLHLAKAAISLEDRPLARVQLDAAIKQLLPAGEMGPMPQASALDGLLLAEAWQTRALLYIAGEDQDELEKALSDCERAVTLLNQELNLRYGDATQLKILEQLHPVYETGMTAAMDLFELTAAYEYQERAFHLAEAGRATLLRTQRMRSGDLAARYPDLFRKEQTLKDNLRQEEALLVLEPTNVKQRQAKIDAYETYTAFLTKTAKDQPDYYQALFAVNPPKINELQQNIDGQTALLEYFVGLENYYIFALTDKEFQVFRLPKKTSLEPKLKLNTSWKGLVAKGKAGPGIYSKLEYQLESVDLEEAIQGFNVAIQKISPKPFVDYGYDLYKKLILPAESIIKNKQKLVIVPHAQLNTVPFEALITKAEEDEKKIKYHKLDYLIKDFSIQYCPYAGDINSTVAPELITEVEPLLAMAPLFTRDSTGSYIRESHRFLFDTLYQSDTALRAISPDGRTFEPLQYSEQEVQNLVALFKQKKTTAKAYFSDQATETTFKEEAPGYQFIHLATHSFINPTNNSLSGIAFYQSKSEKGEDGILYLPEIYPLELNAQLVVLSSCQSALGAYAPGEGALSLTRAFLVAGADHVLSTLWNVYDRYASELMTEFYGELLSEKETAKALRKAKLSLINDKDTANPKIWSGFILNGNWREGAGVRSEK